MGTIIETKGRGQQVRVIAGDGREVEGTVVRGIVEGLSADTGRTLFDLDFPFTLHTDDGDTVRVSSPWNCRISYIDE